MRDHSDLQDERILPIMNNLPSGFLHISKPFFSTHERMDLIGFVSSANGNAQGVPVLVYTMSAHSLRSPDDT